MLAMRRARHKSAEMKQARAQAVVDLGWRRRMTALYVEDVRGGNGCRLTNRCLWCHGRAPEINLTCLDAVIGRRFCMDRRLI